MFVFASGLLLFSYSVSMELMLCTLASRVTRTDIERALSELASVLKTVIPRAAVRNEPARIQDQYAWLYV